MQKLTKEHLKVMNFPSAYIPATLDQVTESIHTHIFNFINNRENLLGRGAGLILSGDVGVGKSAAAAVILKHYRVFGHTGFFISASDLRDYDKKQVLYDNGMSYVERVKTVDVLVLDSLSTDDAREQYGITPKKIADIVEFRKMKNKLTIITTRMKHTQMKTTFPNLMSVGYGYFVWVDVTGENRLDAAQDELDSLIRG